MIRSFDLLAFTLVLPVVVSVSAAAQDAPGAGVDREAMWFAPTAEDWKKPCLVTWQRSYEDALAVAKETGKPILICVNMDGEIASEHYAGVRYRQPDIAALYEPYVTVIASVYRHTPRDYDEEGRRILCPRFGSVTCGEHIAIEPGLFEQFFDDKRIAPRHIAVELERESAEMYDVYYAWDTDTIFTALREGVANRPPPRELRGDRPFAERVTSRDVADREAVEEAYLAGDRAVRRALLQSAVAHADAAPTDLLRLAVFGFDAELARLARQALAESSDPSAIDLILAALRVPMEPEERDALIAALDRIGETSPRARTLAAVQRGLSGSSSAVDVEGWSKALADVAPPPAVESYELASRLSQRAQVSETREGDASARLELAEAFLALALDPATGRDYASLLFEDARRSAREARELGGAGWRVSSVLALAAHHLGDATRALTCAEEAVASLLPANPGALQRAPSAPSDDASKAEALPPDAESPTTAAVLALFAEARRKAIFRAVREKEKWPSQWLADVHAAHSVLARHPFGTDLQGAAHYDFLIWLGGFARAERVLDDGLARFPDSWALHERLRRRILAQQGVGGLEAAYAERLAAPDAPQNLAWYAGYAALVAAEFHRRAGADDEALAAYDRGIALYERAALANPGARATVDHYVALALAGRARIAFEHGEWERATAEIVDSFERAPSAAATLDGLNLSPVDTAKMLRARLDDLQRDELVAKLDAALAELDPEMLLLPAYERDVQNAPPSTGRRRGGRGG